MLVRSPLLTSHKWRELVFSGRLVCRCHYVFLWCYICFVLLRFRLHAFVEAAALRSFVLRYADAPIATCVSFSLLFVWRCHFFGVFFVPLPFSLYMESTPYVLSFQMVFFYLMTTGWVFDISLCENSINQSIMEHESTAGINSLVLTEISESWRTSVIGVVEVKAKIILGKLFLLSLPSCRQRMMLFALRVHSKCCLRKLSLLWAPHLRPLLRDRATRDIDKPEV